MNNAKELRHALRKLDEAKADVKTKKAMIGLWFVAVVLSVAIVVALIIVDVVIAHEGFSIFTTIVGGGFGGMGIVFWGQDSWSALARAKRYERDARYAHEDLVMEGME